MRNILLAGNSGAGKTNLLQLWSGGFFDEGSISTSGFTHSTISENLRVMDVSGQERFKNFSFSLAEKADGIVFVLDLTNEADKDFPVIFLEELRRKDLRFQDPKFLSDFPILIVGNKSDLRKLINCKSPEKDFVRPLEGCANVKILLASAKEDKCGKTLDSQPDTVAVALATAMRGLLEKNNPKPDLVVSHPLPQEASTYQYSYGHSRVVRNEYLQKLVLENKDPLFTECTLLLHDLSLAQGKKTKLWIAEQLASLAPSRDRDSLIKTLRQETEFNCLAILRALSVFEESFYYKLTLFQETKKDMNNEMDFILRCSERMLRIVIATSDAIRAYSDDARGFTHNANEERNELSKTLEGILFKIRGFELSGFSKDCIRELCKPVQEENQEPTTLGL